MELPPEYYDDIVAVYIQIIQQDSPVAAAVIREINMTSRSRAALRATLVITLLKMGALKEGATPDLSSLAFMFKEFPEALPLVDLAVKCWLHDRAVRDATVGRRPDQKLSDAATHASVTPLQDPTGFED